MKVNNIKDSANCQVVLDLSWDSLLTLNGSEGLTFGFQQLLMLMSYVVAELLNFNFNFFFVMDYFP